MVFAFIVLMAAIRVIMPTQGVFTSLAAFSPIGAMALYGGAYFKGYKKYVFPILTLWLSDIILNRFHYFGDWVFFYDGFIWTYGAFVLMVIVGRVLLKKVNIVNFVGSALLITFIHWIVTDLGVFLIGTMYPMTWTGWGACLIAAIPFEQNLLIGTLLYGTVMFGVFEWVTVKKTSLET